MICEEDKEGKPVEAFYAYDKIIKNGNTDMDTYINFSFLCWRMTDFGFNTYYAIDLELIGRAQEMYPKLIEDAKLRSDGDMLPRFWELYFYHRNLGEEIDVSEVQKILLKTSSTDPYLYYLINDFLIPEKQFHKLIKNLKSPSFKHRYILGYLSNYEMGS